MFESPQGAIPMEDLAEYLSHDRAPSTPSELPGWTGQVHVVVDVCTGQQGETIGRFTRLRWRAVQDLASGEFPVPEGGYPASMLRTMFPNLTAMLALDAGALAGLWDVKP